MTLSLKSELEVVFEPCGDRNGNAACKFNKGSVAHKARLDHENLITGVDDPAQCKVDSLRAADSYDNFVLAVVFHSVLALNHVRDLGSQRSKTLIRAVYYLLALKNLYGSLSDDPWR